MFSVALTDLRDAENIAKIGERDRRHGYRRGGSELRNAYDAIDQRKFGMHSQMDEGGAHGRYFHRKRRRSERDRWPV